MHTNINHRNETIKELQDIPDDQVVNILNIVSIFKKSIIMQESLDFKLKKEFSDWDVLSDEALTDFEEALS